MRPEKSTDNRFPWHEALTPAARPARQPATWLITPAEAPVPVEAAEGSGDEDWATQALFDYYNN
ncbi:MAG: hypothetical protein IT318_13820 [Anaerolineales bacterium]|nr:hypothetical protein [Anaerolineales bacterium]